MSVLITSRRINNVVDQRASLGNDQVIRLTDVGDSWTKIRLAVRITINASTSITGTPMFYFGMCDGADGAGSQVTINFVGLVSIDAVWNYSSLGVPSVVQSQSQACKRSFGVNTLVGASTNLTITTDPVNYRSFLAVTIDRTDPANTTVEMIAPFNVLSGVYDVSLAAFFEQLKSETVVTLTDYGRTVFTGTLDMTAANLDSVNLSFNKTPNRIEICDFAYHVFA
jgi:hypothetical protein